MGDLTALQEKAAQLHALHGKTKSDAYREAGYSVENMLNESINQEASRLFALPHVSSRVEVLQKLALERQMVTVDRVVAELAKLSFVDITQAFYSNGALKPLNEIPEDVRACIIGLEVTEETIDEDGTIAQVKKVKFADKKGSLELLGKQLQMFVNVSKVQHTGKDGESLQNTQTVVMTEAAIKSVVKQVQDEF